MIKEEGTLPIGVEFDGEVHRDFVLRPQVVRDTIDLMDSEYADRANKNDHYFGICLLAGQLEKLGNIPVEEITPDLLLNMYDDDFRVIHLAKEALESRLSTFRKENEGKEEAASVAA
ncbi:MAG: hypothetical protein OEV42_15165 [Deltaproteobacteria bacterium]|nr:hypothetical protein [Deltaproteobacteria bacterium]